MSAAARLMPQQAEFPRVPTVNLLAARPSFLRWGETAACFPTMPTVNPSGKRAGRVRGDAAGRVVFVQGRAGRLGGLLGISPKPSQLARKPSSARINGDAPDIQEALLFLRRPNAAAMPSSWPTCSPSPPPSIGASNAACGENCAPCEAPLDRFGQRADSFCGDRAGGSAGSRKRHVEAAKGAAQRLCCKTPRNAKIAKIGSSLASPDCHHPEFGNKAAAQGQNVPELARIIPSLATKPQHRAKTC